MESVNTVNLSLEEKCMDKSWMVRLKSYEEVTKLFRQIKNRKSPEFHRFIGLIKNFVTDNHATAQEKGLEAALAYIENYTHAKNIVHDVMNGIVTKCIAARREKTKELAMQITHKYVQLGKQEAVQEELLNAESTNGANVNYTGHPRNVQNDSKHRTRTSQKPVQSSKV